MMQLSINHALLLLLLFFYDKMMGFFFKQIKTNIDR